VSFTFALAASALAFGAPDARLGARTGASVRTKRPLTRGRESAIVLRAV
jgi:hypothetical protein